MSDETEKLVRDTGDQAEVPDRDRLKTDGGDASNALEGGDDVEAAEAWFAEPGEVVTIEEDGS